jgi:glycosyltransferase involved in cell wall biosynthesis
LRRSTLEKFESTDVVKMSSKFDRLKLFWYMPGKVQQYNPDVVFTIFGPAYWKCPVPHLQGFAHFTLINSPDKRIESVLSRSFASQVLDRLKIRLFRRAEYLVVETDFVRSRLISLGFDKNRIFVVRNSYSPLFKKEISKVRAGNVGKVFTFLVPGSYYKHKNLESIPETAAKLRSITSKPFQFIFTLPHEHFGWKRIKNKAVSFGVGGRLKTVGNVPHAEIGRLYREANAVCLPTLLESSTAVYPEAFISRLPLITSDLDFAHELCGKGALYFDPFSPLDMANKLSQIIQKPALRTSLVSSGIKILREKYPSPEKKWQDQLECLETVARLGKVRGKG